MCVGGGSSSSLQHRPLKFETAWLLDPECENIERASWGSNVDLNISKRGCVVAVELVGWCKLKYGDLSKRIKELEKHLTLVQLGVLVEDCEANVTLQDEFDSLLEKQEA